VSSVERNERGDELNGCEKSAGKLVISRCNGSELFEIIEETFDEIAFAIKPRSLLAWAWCDWLLAE
jgi:hypothetical protein